MLMVLIVILIFFLFRVWWVNRNGINGGCPGRELLELINGGLGLFDEPVDRLTGAVVPEAVLDIVELDGSVGRETDSPVSRPLCSADLAVPVFPSGRPDNVPSLNLHNFSDDPCVP